MPQPIVPDSNSWLADGWKVAGAIGTGFLLIVWWLWNQMVARLVTFGTRLDTLERTAVTREELKELVGQMRTDAEQRELRLREDRQSMHRENKEDIGETKESLRRIEVKLDATQPGVVASQLERARQDIQNLTSYAEELKHQHIDPYEREVGKLRAEVDNLKRQVEERE